MLAPPPEAAKPPGGLSPFDSTVSFQASSGMYFNAVTTASLPVLEAAQYGGSAAAVVFGTVPVTVPAESPVNSFPPAPVTSGIEAGASTARPVVAEVLELDSQSAAPPSPDDAVIVWPCNCPCCAHV